MKIQKRNHGVLNRTNLADVSAPLFVVAADKARGMIQVQLPTKNVGELKQGDPIYVLQFTPAETERLIGQLQRALERAKELNDG